MQTIFGDLSVISSGVEMALEILSARGVQTAVDGDHADGGGLVLRIRGSNAHWLFRYTSPNGRRRDAGFGTAHRDSLAIAGESLRLARERARRARDVLAAGGDPLEQKRIARKAAAELIATVKAERKAEATTLARCARDYHARAVEPRFTEKHAALWISSLENNIPHDLWQAPIDRIEPVALFQAMAASKKRIPESAKKIRQRLDAIFDDALFHGLCANNPARVICGKLRNEPRGREQGHYRALNYSDVPAFVEMLRRQSGTAARAMEFGLLTCGRTNEILGATWEEIDISAAIWRVPAARMKTREPHDVHLTARTLDILVQMKSLGGAFVFPSHRDPNKSLSNMALLLLLDRMGYRSKTTVHGICRATFATWAAEKNIARPDVVEAALAHREADKVRAAYARASFAAERAALLNAWATYCESGKLPNSSHASTARVFPIGRSV